MVLRLPFYFEFELDYEEILIQIYRDENVNILILMISKTYHPRPPYRRRGRDRRRGRKGRRSNSDTEADSDPEGEAKPGLETDTPF
jgi:hypothetical protein